MPLFVILPSTSRITQHKKDEETYNDKCPYLDVKCPLCLTFGHPKQHCDHMAIWLILKENSKLVDDKFRQKLLANYAAVDAKRQTKKINKIKGTVRLLYQNGQITEGEQLLDRTLSFLQQPLEGSKQDSSDSEDSQDS
jgi:hypothetical protein